MPLTLEELLERSRKELLDLSTRNRLLSVPVGSKPARVIQIQDELSEEVFRILVAEKKSMSFLPGRPSSGRGRSGGKVDASEADEGDEPFGRPALVAELEDDETGPASRHTDAKLQTSLSPEGLQGRLLGLYRDSRTMLEEQGVNILYLALGQLKWYEAEQADSPRYAPLVLVPVEIRRRTASERFFIRWLEEDVQENLSLRAKLRTDFQIDLPEFPDEDQVDLQSYFAAVSDVIAGAKGWEVRTNSMVLGFFSFAKFLMFRDLDPQNWPEGKGLLQHPFLRGLLQDGFPQSDGLFSDDTNLDELIPVERLDHVVDADGSQSLAIEAVRQGANLVIQGPPGTGKSQSISNIIATAVLDGKKVLFVAEKLAALDVVKRRLEKAGLGDLCLELHSNKSNKRAVVAEVGRTWTLGRPKASDLESLNENLERRRAILNRHAKILHEPFEPSKITPFAAIGALVLLGANGRESGNTAFSKAELWTREDYQERRTLFSDLAARITEMGRPTSHPWRGVCSETVMNRLDLEPLEANILSLRKIVEMLRSLSEALALALGRPVPETITELDEQLLIAKYVVLAPPVDREALCNSVWNDGLPQLKELLSAGLELSRAREALSGRVIDSAWEQDLTDARLHIAAHGQSWFRIFNKPYRQSLAGFRGLLVGPLPRSYDGRIQLLDQLIKGQGSYREVTAASELGRTAFGGRWRQDKTDWKELESVMAWVEQHQAAGLGDEFRRLFAGVHDANLVQKMSHEVSQLVGEFTKLRNTIYESLALDSSQAFGVERAAAVPFRAVQERCDHWLSKMEELSRWNQFYIRCCRARALGCGALLSGLETGKVPAQSATDCFDRIYFSQLLRELMRSNPSLAEFDGIQHDREVEAFCRMDIDRLTLSKYRVIKAHYDSRPISGGVGQAGVLRGEMERKRGHRPVRRLLKDAGSVVQAIKPVFMMSPLSVAQFLEPGAVEFDLLVIDEASQVQPVDALGAIARCRQVVVVGDSKQLPPSRFFTRMTSDSEDDDLDELESATAAEAKDVESILGLCSARGLPQSMLRWHYRSRHHSLIAVSNHHFYENRLFIVPSPHEVSPNNGLEFYYVKDGIFDSGGTATNLIEAKAVCRAVADHARNRPELSLGVVAFSVRQRDAILDELETLRKETPELDLFFDSHPNEPFFVKNLENVQGDERDVIYISVGYGKNAQGYLAMRFGPLSSDGGERRLNVLISRAKRRCEVFSSILAEEIDLARASGKGVAALKTFLTYARTKVLGNSVESGRSEDSPFEVAVRRAVESLGYEVEPQVGVAGFFIDLAVRNPNNRGHYLLGIECDGAGYHSSRSARERDRLRQAVLEDHGWTIHRIWSTDWFQRPDEQLSKVRYAIECAAREFREVIEGLPTGSSRTRSPEQPSTVDREPEIGAKPLEVQNLGVPYIEADVAVPKRREPHELPVAEMADIVLQILEQEGPIHELELIVRVRDLWGLNRAGARIQECVDSAIDSLLANYRCVNDKCFLSLLGKPVPIRNREGVNSVSLKKPDMLPPAEIRAAALALIDSCHGAAPEELVVAIARLLGFRNTGSQLRAVIESQLERMRTDGTVTDVNGILKRSPQ